MSHKIAAESLPTPTAEVVVVVVREYEEERDKAAVEELERRCEFGSLVTDLMGDPLCRVRNFLSHVMLVAEDGEEREIVGVVRGCIKTVTRGGAGGGGRGNNELKSSHDHMPPPPPAAAAASAYVKLGYILGLRVLPSHRRVGIGARLIGHVEEWCKGNGAEFAYMATVSSNQASLNLFNLKCRFDKFRKAKMLVQPVHAHYKPLPSGTQVLQLPPGLADSIYRRVFSNSEFFPKDLDLILNNKLNLGTFMAVPKNYWDPSNAAAINGEITLPSSFAILSVWNTNEVYKLQVKGVSSLKYACCVGSRVLDSLMPWLRLPSIPDLFKNFGVYFLYGLHMEGRGASRLMKSLCAFVHNMARDDVGCGALVAEVGHRDPLREAVPHWRRFSPDDDIWCIKKLTTAEQETNDGDDDDWIRSIQPASSSSSSIFVDPRDF